MWNKLESSSSRRVWGSKVKELKVSLNQSLIHLLGCVFVIIILTILPLTNVLLERFFRSALSIQLQFFFNVRSRSNA